MTVQRPQNRPPVDAKRKIRVGMIVHSYLPFDRAGVPLYVDRLARGMSASERIHISCITPSQSRSMVTRNHDGYSVYYIPMLSMMQGMIRWLLFFTIALLRHGPKIVHRDKIDILHGHSTYYAGFQTVILGMLTRRPVVLTLHGSDKQGPFLRFIKKANLIIVQRKALLRELIEKGVDPHRIRLVPNCIEIGSTSIESLPKRQPSIVFVARIIPSKRPDLFVDALAIVVQNSPHAKGIVMGGGLMLEGLKKQARDLGIEESIEFTGVVENPFGKLHEGDIFVACSDIENFSSTSLLEAMDKAMAVIVTDVGETRELIHNRQNGLVVDVTRETIANAIMRVLQDESLREHLCRNGQETVRNLFSQTDLQSWHERAYIEIAKEYARRTVSSYPKSLLP